MVPGLTDLCLDLQIHICEFLHPLHILALRQTCKACHAATSQRIVWIGALNRTCRHNSLFLPSFPIPDMSLLELERAATAPSRWIMLSSSKDRNPNKLLPSRTTRITNNSIPFTLDDLTLQNLYLVPGGRYLVASSGLSRRTCDCVGVWDLGYVFDGAMSSDEKMTKVWVTRINGLGHFIVCPTPDGLGIRILTYSDHNSIYTLSLFEIYPQKNTHEHAKFGELTLIHDCYGKPVLCGNRAIIYVPTTGTVIVWDFMANTNWSFRIPRGDDWTILIGATETTICLFDDAIYEIDFMIRIFEIPPKTPVFDNEDDLPKVAPIFEFKDSTVIPTFSQSPDSWYFGRGDLNPPPVYLDVRDRLTGKLSRYTLDITSGDLSDLSPSPFVNSGWAYIEIKDENQVVSYRICGNSSVHLDSDYKGTAAITVGFESSKCHDSSQTATAHVYCTRFAQARINTSPADHFCPASGRLVYVNDSAFVISDYL